MEGHEFADHSVVFVIRGGNRAIGGVRGAQPSIGLEEDQNHLDGSPGRFL
jgi:hypothetical protein